MPITVIPPVKVGVEWWVKFPDRMPLVKCKVTALGATVVTLDYHLDGYRYSNTFSECDVSFIEPVGLSGE